MKELTKAEDQIMQLLWKLEKAFVKDIIEQMPIPKPAYNTVSTIIRILEKKGFVGHKAVGTTYLYFPLIKKEEYLKVSVQTFPALLQFLLFDHLFLLSVVRALDSSIAYFLFPR